MMVVIINVGGHDSCPDDDNGDVVNYSDDRGGGIVVLCKLRFFSSGSGSGSGCFTVLNSGSGSSSGCFTYVNSGLDSSCFISISGSLVTR